jgi:hypothetical protein
MWTSDANRKKFSLMISVSALPNRSRRWAVVLVQGSGAQFAAPRPPCLRAPSCDGSTARNCSRRAALEAIEAHPTSIRMIPTVLMLHPRPDLDGKGQNRADHQKKDAHSEIRRFGLSTMARPPSCAWPCWRAAGCGPCAARGGYALRLRVILVGVDRPQDRRSNCEVGMHCRLPSSEHGQTTRGGGVARAVIGRPRHAGGDERSCPGQVARRRSKNER